MTHRIRDGQTVVVYIVEYTSRSLILSSKDSLEVSCNTLRSCNMTKDSSGAYFAPVTLIQTLLLNSVK